MAKICQTLHLQLKQTPHNEKVKNNCCFTHFKTSLNSDLILVCGLYYKHTTIINYASGIINKVEALHNGNARVIIYNRHVFIVQATGLITPRGLK